MKADETLGYRLKLCILGLTPSRETTLNPLNIHSSFIAVTRARSAQLKDAQLDLQRYQVLVEQDSIPRQQLDAQVATVHQLEAALKTDQGQVEGGSGDSFRDRRRFVGHDRTFLEVWQQRRDNEEGRNAIHRREFAPRGFNIASCLASGRRLA